MAKQKSTIAGKGVFVAIYTPFHPPSSLRLKPPSIQIVPGSISTYTSLRRRFSPPPPPQKKKHTNWCCSMTHRVHVWYIYLHMVIWLIFWVNVGKYTSTMDPVGDGGGFWRSSKKQESCFLHGKVDRDRKNVDFLDLPEGIPFRRQWTVRVNLSVEARWTNFMFCFADLNWKTCNKGPWWLFRVYIGDNTTLFIRILIYQPVFNGK